MSKATVSEFYNKCFNQNVMYVEYHHISSAFHKVVSLKRKSFCLFDLMLYIRSKQLRSCYNGPLLDHTSPGQDKNVMNTEMFT